MLIFSKLLYQSVDNMSIYWQNDKKISTFYGSDVSRETTGYFDCFDMY